MKRYWTLLRCRLRGHTPLLHIAEHRLWLRCVEPGCGYETPGWSLVPRPLPARSAKMIRFLKRLTA